MNLYAAIILTALIAEYVTELLADRANARALDPELPKEFDGVYDADSYRRSQEYTRARARFSLWPSTASLISLLVFWWLGGFGWLDGAVRELDRGPILTGLVFMGALFIAQGILGLPFQWWSTFVIEERFGFNRTDAKTFWGDRAKGLALAVVLGGPLLALILFFFDRAGSSAWLWCWGVATAFSLAVQFIAPTWLMPLFNKFTPLEDGELKSALTKYADSVAFPLDDVFVIDGSKRSSKANAFFTGFGKHKRIALFDTLVEQQSPDELVAVLAHEIGHYKRKHILKSMVLSFLHTGLLFWLLSYFLSEPALFQAFRIEVPSIYAGLVFFGLLLKPVEMGLSLALHAFSRKNEFEADAFAAETTGQPEKLISALKKLSLESLSNLTPHPVYVLLHYSHPPVLQRIAALRG